MGIYQIFASNLRDECLRHGTIADVCRGIGINRQQFNKYLAGQTLPNAATLRRICDFLQIQEHELLTEKASNDAVFNSRRSQRFLTSLEHFIRSAIPEEGLAYGLDIKNISEGAYFCYFPLPNTPDRYLRSLVRVSRVKGLLYFTRLTRTNAPGKGFIFRGKHIGMITASAGSVHFLGRNRVPPYQMSFMSFDTKNLFNGRFMFGVGITRSTVDSIAVRIVLERIMTPVTKSDIRRIGQVSAADNNLDPIILAAFAQPVTQGNFLSFASMDALVSTAYYASGGRQQPETKPTVDDELKQFY